MAYRPLAVLLDRAAGGPALIVAPTSVGDNWIRETARFAPALAAHSYREHDSPLAVLPWPPSTVPYLPVTLLATPPPTVP